MVWNRAPRSRVKYPRWAIYRGPITPLITGRGPPCMPRCPPRKTANNDGLHNPSKMRPAISLVGIWSWCGPLKFPWHNNWSLKTNYATEGSFMIQGDMFKFQPLVFRGVRTLWSKNDGSWNATPIWTHQSGKPASEIGPLCTPKEFWMKFCLFG